MIKKLPYAALAALISMPLVAGAQDPDLVGPAEQLVPVAAEDPVSEQASSGREADEERLLEEFARYRQTVQEGILDEADLAAKRIVELAIKVYGPLSRETASALNNLAIVQHSTGQYDAAIQNFTSAIEIIEVVEDRLNAALVNPLKGLGAAQLTSGQTVQAKQTFERATHITHVNEGPHNLNQVEILESIAETYVRMGELDEARDILDRIHALNVKHFEQNPLGLLPSLMTRADWQHRARYFDDERISYRRAIRIIEAGSGPDDPLLVEPLRRLGESFYYYDPETTPTQQMGLVATGEMYFKRAARIAEEADDFVRQELVRTQLALGDYYTYLEKHSRAKRIYADVWEQLASDEEGLALRDELFRDPVAIWTEPLPEFAGDGSELRSDIASGRIVVNFDVSAFGRIRELRSEAFPPEFTDMLRVVHRGIRGRVFRPRLADGVPVEAPGLIFEHAFSYSRSDLDKMRADAAKAAESAADKAKPETDEPETEASETDEQPEPDSE